jgi:outer membrane lipoprotein-sorting protein
MKIFSKQGSLKKLNYLIMKNLGYKLGIVLITVSFGFLNTGYSQDATEIVRLANDKMQGEKSSKSTMTMTIVRPKWQRQVSFKSWTKGTEYSMTIVTAPAPDKGQVFLKRDREMWNWNPKISRMIKLPPSMLSQGWMGSDYTNDDLLNQASVVVDYIHKILGSETQQGRDCYKIQLTPKEDAPVVWGKIIMWIDKKDYLMLRVEYYDEDGYLVKTEIGQDIKTLSGRVITTTFILIPADEEGHKTIVHLDSIEFNIPIEDTFFSQQNMKRLR